MFEVREAQAEDEPFLRLLFRMTRSSAVQALPGPMMDFQFVARERAYQAAFPHLQTFLLIESGVAKGALTIAEDLDEVHLLDVGVLPTFQGAGVGRIAWGWLEERVGSRAVYLTVELGTVAEGWYRRLGFVESAPSDDGLRVPMHWKRAE